MNFENQPHHEDGQLGARNKLQLLLAENWLGFEPDKNQLLDWMETHGRAVSELLNEDPKIIDRFQQDEGETVKEVLGRLHQKENA